MIADFFRRVRKHTSQHLLHIARSRVQLRVILCWRAQNREGHVGVRLDRRSDAEQLSFAVVTDEHRNEVVQRGLKFVAVSGLNDECGLLRNRSELYVGDTVADYTPPQERPDGLGHKPGGRYIDQSNF